VKHPAGLAVPTNKNDEGILRADAHLVCYVIENEGPQPASRSVMVLNQFGFVTVRTEQVRELCAPASKTTNPDGEPGPPPAGIDHYKCYELDGQLFPSRMVTLVDQFGRLFVRVEEPRRLCNPVTKIHGGTTSSATHVERLVCYSIDASGYTQRTVATRDQFGRLRLRPARPKMLCVPSLRL
jgi:hypothetical protein